MDRKKAEDQRQVSDTDETVEQPARSDGVSWQEHVLRKDQKNSQRKELHLNVGGTRKTGRPKKACIMTVEEDGWSGG